MSVTGIYQATSGPTCRCRICVRHAEFESTMASLFCSDTAVAFLEKIYEDLMYAEIDRDYNRAILEGKWPQSDEIIASIRDRTLQVLTLPEHK